MLTQRPSLVGRRNKEEYFLYPDASSVGGIVSLRRRRSQE